MPSYVNRAADLAMSLASDVANDERNLTAVERFAICLRTGHFERAHSRHQAGLFSDAGCYEAALPLFEQNGVWRKAGDCLWAMGRLDEAERAYERPANRGGDKAFRSGPDHDRLMAIAALSGRWDRIPQLLQDGQPAAFTGKGVVFSGSARAKGPLLRLLAMAVRHGATSPTEKRLLGAFNVTTDEWAAILCKEMDRSDADLAKQLGKLQPSFLRVTVSDSAEATAAGSTDRADAVIAYISAVETRLPEIVRCFKEWQAMPGAAFPLSVVYWLTETGLYSMFKTCLHSLRCEVDSWVSPGPSDTKFYAAHPWITRACSDELVRACLTEQAPLSPDLLVSALMQHLNMDLAFDLEGDKPGHKTFERIKSQPAWAASRLAEWMGGETYAALFDSFKMEGRRRQRFQNLVAEPTWAALMQAAAVHVDACWNTDFSETRWRSEHALFLRIKERLAPFRTEQHASPIWLSPQHLDVFLPDQRVAIEYQGEQHYAPIDIFGGEAGFRETVRRDEQKRQLCRIAGIVLVEVRFDDDVDARLIEISNLARARNKDRRPIGPRLSGLEPSLVRQ